MRFRIIGRGRAGGAFANALTSVGWELDATYGRADDPVDAATGVPVVLLCVPDGALAAVAEAVTPGEAAVVHVAGSQGLGVLAGHARPGSIHPLMTLPDPERGARRLLDRCQFAVAGDPITTTIAQALGGRAFAVGDDQRMLYHAAAAVASNHLVALAAQVQRLAVAAGVPADAYWPLMAASLDNVAEVGPGRALTGPAARADWQTVRGHLAAMAETQAGASEPEPTTAPTSHRASPSPPPSTSPSTPTSTPTSPRASPSPPPSTSPSGLGSDRPREWDRTLYLSLAAEAARLAGHELPQDLL